MILLLSLFLGPLVGVLFLSLVDKKAKEKARKTAILFSLIPLALLVVFGKQLLAAESKMAWIASFHVFFHLGVDPISAVFIALAAVIVPLVIGFIPAEEWSRLSLGLVLVAESFLIGFFEAKDLIVFILFWEAMLLPLFLAVYLYGGKERKRAAFQFILYMMTGSVLLIVGALTLYFATGTFEIEEIAAKGDSLTGAVVIFIIFMVAFAVKAPLFPFHGWLPLVYVEAPMWGTILLSALLSKAAVYGVIRIGFGFFPDAMLFFSPYLLGLATIGVLYGAMAAFVQNNYKALFAYASFSHLNFILAALFVDQEVAHVGAIIQAFNHGIVITALFMMAEFLRVRTGSLAMDAGKGLTAYYPHLAWLTFFFLLSAIALPGTGSFMGELLMLVGIVSANSVLGIFLVASLLLTLLYMLRFFQKVFQGPLLLERPLMGDIEPREFLLALPLIGFTLWLGLYPAPIFQFLEGAMRNL